MQKFAYIIDTRKPVSDNEIPQTEIRLHFDSNPEAKKRLRGMVFLKFSESNGQVFPVFTDPKNITY